MNLPESLVRNVVDNMKRATNHEYPRQAKRARPGPNNLADRCINSGPGVQLEEIIKLLAFQPRISCTVLQATLMAAPSIHIIMRDMT
jgi:hypothetical protein